MERSIFIEHDVMIKEDSGLVYFLDWQDYSCSESYYKQLIGETESEFKERLLKNLKEFKGNVLIK